MHDKAVVRGDKRYRRKIDEGVLRWFGHVEGMENDRIAKRVYVGESAGRGRGLDIRQARRMVHD